MERNVKFFSNCPEYIGYTDSGLEEDLFVANSQQ